MNTYQMPRETTNYEDLEQSMQEESKEVQWINKVFC